MPEVFLHLTLVYLLTLMLSLICSISAGMLSMHHLTRARRMERITLDAYFEGRNLSLFAVFFFARYSILLAASVGTFDLLLYYGMKPDKSVLMLAFVWLASFCGLHFCSHMIDAFWTDVVELNRKVAKEMENAADESK